MCHEMCSIFKGETCENCVPLLSRGIRVGQHTECIANCCLATTRVLELCTT